MGIEPLDVLGGRGDIELWGDWYKGYVRKAHSYTVFNGIRKLSRRRAVVNMAKRICEDWANLLLNEKVSVTAENESATKALNEIFADNSLNVQANRLVELTFALGTGAFVEQIRGGKVKIDCVRAEYIYPIACEAGKITECAFGQKITIGRDERYYIQVHRRDERGGYYVENALFDKHGARLPLPDTVEEVYSAPDGKALFQIITPNIVNARRTDSPFGASVFSSALDELRGCDLIFDSLLNEFLLGKKRIFLPTSMIQMQTDEKGAVKPAFDPEDVVFHALRLGSDDKDNKPYEMNMDLRVNEHVAGLQTVMGMLSDKCGLGNDRYRYDEARHEVKTATEVISEKSELFQNLKKHEIILGEALRNMTEAALKLAGISDAGEITVQFDDSIIEDKASEFTQKTQLVGLNVLAPWELRAWYTGESEEEARKRCAEIAAASMPDSFEGDE